MCLERGEHLSKRSICRLMKELGKVVSIFESHRCPLAGVRRDRMRSVPDEQGTASAPSRQVRYIVNGNVEDASRGLNKLRNGMSPVAMKIHQALAELLLSGGGHLIPAVERRRGSAPPYGARAVGGKGVEVAEEAIFPEDEVNALMRTRCKVALHAGAVAAGSQHAGVFGLWRVGHDRLTNLGADSVGANDEISLNDSTVGKVSGDRTVRFIFDVDQPLAVRDRDAVGLGLLDDDLV
jgi:hypothetical protein